MEILIRKEPNGSIYLDKTNAIYFDALNMSREPYNFTKIQIDDKYRDCEGVDFDDNLKFNVEKYKARKEQISRKKEILRLKQELIPIKEDVEQVELFGMERADYAYKKQRCKDIVLRLRALERQEVSSDGKLF